MTTSNLKPYSAYKDSGVEWLGEVPQHWTVLPGRACYVEKKVPNLALKEKNVLSLSYGRIVVKPPEKLHGLVPSSFESYQIVEPLDIVVRPTDLQNDWNSLRFGLSRHLGIITSAYLCFRTKNTLTPEFGHLLLHSYDLMKVFYGLGSGLRQNLDWSDFKHLACSIPPLPEQTAIVRFLDHADRRIRRYIRAKQKLIALLEEQKQAIIQQAVTGKIDVCTGEPYPAYKDSGVEWLGKVPEHWELRRLKWVTRLQRGYDLPADRRVPGPFPVVSSGGVIGSHVEARCTGPGVVMGRYGSTEAVFFVDRDFWPHNTSLFVTDFQGNTKKWCFYLLRSISKADQAGKSAVPGIDRKDLFQIVVCVPPLEEQRRTVQAIEAITDRFTKAMSTAGDEIDLLREYQTRLISDVVTGKLDLREAAAELAEEDDLYDTEESAEDKIIDCPLL